MMPESVELWMTIFIQQTGQGKPPAHAAEWADQAKRHFEGRFGPKGEKNEPVSEAPQIV